MTKELDEYFRFLRSWEGVGDLKEVFSVASGELDMSTLAAGPVQIQRTSEIRFAWDGSLGCVRTISKSRTPTLLTQSKSKLEIAENLQINCLIRPDGFFKFEPGIAYSDFKGYTKSGKTGRVLEKKSMDDYKRDRSYSYLFDPQTVFELNDSRLDQWAHGLKLGIQMGFTSVRDEGDSLKVVQTFRNNGGSELTVEVQCSKKIKFLPLSRTEYIGKDLQEVREWQYDMVEGVPICKADTRTKYVKGVFCSSRGISLQEYKVNENYSLGDFSFSSIGVADAERMIDRVGKKIFLLQDGASKEITMKPLGMNLWLVYANITALCLLLVGFGLRRRNATSL